MGISLYIILGASQAQEYGAPVAKVGDDYAYIGICLAAKDDAGSLAEWIDYHHCLGVGKFYVYDDSSSPAMAPAIEKYIGSGLVEYSYIDVGTELAAGLNTGVIIS